MTTRIAITGRGQRGESFTDVARRIGTFGGITVDPSDTDQEVLDKIAEETTGAALAAAEEAANSAAVAVAASGTIYDSTAEGLAATTDGDSFVVASSVGTKLAAVYRNDGGSAVLLYIIPNAGGVPALGQWQRFLAKIENGDEDVNVVLAGDSTGDATNEWFYLLGAALAALYPTHTVRHRLWNDATPAFGSATTIATGSGSRVITLWNGSIAGSVANRLAGDNFGAVFVTPAPDLIFLSYGHNGSSDAVRQLSFYHGLVDKLRKRCQTVPVIQIGQNPTTSDETMAAKVAQFRALAAREGWGFISVHDAFKQAGVPLGDLMADSVHPNAAGSALWRDTVLASMQASRGVSGGASTSAPVMIRGWTTASDFRQWTKSNTTVTAQNTVGQYETAGASAEVTTVSTSSGGHITIVAVNGDDVPALIGKQVTFAVWQRVPAGNSANSGRIEISDDAGQTNSTGVQQGNGFTLFTVTREIQSTTSINLLIYSSEVAASPADKIQVDRASLSVGLSPVDPLSPFDVAGRFLRIVGGSSNGIGWAYNSAGTGSGYRFYGSTTAADGEWLSDFCPDGLKAKSSGDTHERLSATGSGVRFGPGSGPTDMGIDRSFSGIMRFSGADLYPDTDGTRYFGSSSQQFRAAFVKDGVYVQNKLKLGVTSLPTLTAATDAASTQALANAIRTLLINEGLAL